MIQLKQRSWWSVLSDVICQALVLSAVIAGVACGVPFAMNIVAFLSFFFFAIALLFMVLMPVSADSDSVHQMPKRSIIGKMSTRITTPVEVILLAGFGHFGLATLWAVGWCFAEVGWGIVKQKGKEPSA